MFPNNKLNEMIKKIYPFLIILVFTVIITDYFFFYKKISNYKNNLGNNNNFIVLTGGNNRVKKSLQIFFDTKNKDKNLLISGVGKGFNKNTLKSLTQNNNNEKIIECCIEIEGVSNNTFSNAVESLKWVKTKKINSLVLLTNNYHMPRAMLEFETIFKDVKILPYVFIDKNKIWWKRKTNYISEYFKYKLTYLRINLLQF